MDRDSDVQFEIILDKSNATYKPKVVLKFF